MRRTITIDDGSVYYLGKEVAYMFIAIRKHFKLFDSKTHKYVITIIEAEKGRYRFRNGCDHNSSMYMLCDGDDEIEQICKSKFTRIFFRPWLRKRYNITVEKVRIKRR